MHPREMMKSAAALGFLLVLAAQCSSHMSPLPAVPRAAAGLLPGKGGGGLGLGLRLRGGGCGDGGNQEGEAEDESIPDGAELMSEEEMRREMRDAGEQMEEEVTIAEI